MLYTAIDYPLEMKIYADGNLDPSSFPLVSDVHHLLSEGKGH